MRFLGSALNVKRKMNLSSSIIVVFFIVSLTESAEKSANISFSLKIDGFQKECDAPGCRYTGKIVGSLTSSGFGSLTSSGFDPTPQLCFFIFLSGVVKTPEAQYVPICLIDTYPCDNCRYPYTACNCSGTNPVKIQFYPFHGPRYRLSVYGSLEKNYGKYPYLVPADFNLIATSNIFDASIKPDDWDPIYVHDHENSQIPIQFSTNGNIQLDSGTNMVGTATLFAILLVKSMLNEQGFE